MSVTRTPRQPSESVCRGPARNTCVGQVASRIVRLDKAEEACRKCVRRGRADTEVQGPQDLRLHH